MDSDYHAVPRNMGVVMSPIQSEKKKPIVPVYSFTWFDIIVVLISMGTYIADIVTDILVTLVYWKLDEKAWAGLTLGFLIIPSIIMQIFSTRWYMADGHRISLSTIIAHLFMMGPIQRYVAVLRFGLQARRTKRIEDYQAMYSQLSDVSMLRLFESFLESAPQLVLQLYIMIEVVEEDHILTGIAAFFSLISLSWAIAAYTKALRTAVFSHDSRKRGVSWSGLALQTIWRVGMVAGRIVALVLFATVYPVWLLGGVAVHWFIMTVWLVAQDTDFCGSWWEERLFNTVVGVIHIFCFFNMKEGRSRWRMMVFYVIMLVENTAMILLWFPQRTEGLWFNVPAMTTVWGGFLLGFSSMILYYQYFHPSSPRKCHCCMLYYHLVYRCCPCDGVSTYHATPYKRNVAIPRSFSEEDSDDSDCDKYRPVSGVYIGKEGGMFQDPIEDDDEKIHNRREQTTRKVSNVEFTRKRVGGKLFENKYTSNVRGSGDKNVKLVKMKSFDSPRDLEKRRKNDKKLMMPQPKATSTPGDDLEEKYGRIGRRQQGNCDVILKDYEVTFGDCDVIKQVDSKDNSSSSLSSSSLEDVSFQGRDDFSLIRKTVLKEEGPLGGITSTPSVLKNLPGAATGPCTNKGNSTLVREWVKKTQDIYKPMSEESVKVSFDVTEETKFDFGTMRSTTKDERDFVEMYFGDGTKTTQPTGRRDIMRMKSFNKKDRQRRAPVVKKRNRKRRRSSYNMTDIRNSFREAFGFHAIDVDQVPPPVAEDDDIRLHVDEVCHLVAVSEEEYIEKPRKGRKDRKKRGNLSKDSELPESDSDCQENRNHLNYYKKEPEKHEHDNRAENDQRDGGIIENPKPLNMILARIDQPPNITEMELYTRSKEKKGASNGTSECEQKDNDEIREKPKQEENFTGGVDFGEPLTVMETLHGTAALIQGEKIKSAVIPADNVEVTTDRGSRLVWKKPAADICGLIEPTTSKAEAKPAEIQATVAGFADFNEENGVKFYLGSSPPESHPSQNESKISFPEKSTYDNLTASDIGQDKGEKKDQEEGPEKKDSCPIASKKPEFGPIIQIRGDKIVVTHKNVTKSELISNPVKKDELTSKPAYVGPPRRDRIEYLYKVGRHGLMKAAQDSPARKRLLFKREKMSEYEGWSDVELDDIQENEIPKKTDEKSHFYVENEVKKGQSAKVRDDQNIPPSKMEKSIEALGTSMEGVIDGEENYKIHIRDAEKNRHRKEKVFAKILGENVSKRRVSKKISSKPVENHPKGNSGKIVRQRRTLGSIENRNEMF